MILKITEEILSTWYGRFYFLVMTHSFPSKYFNGKSGFLFSSLESGQTCDCSMSNAV